MGNADSRQPSRLPLLRGWYLSNTSVRASFLGGIVDHSSCGVVGRIADSHGHRRFRAQVPNPVGAVTATGEHVERVVGVGGEPDLDLVRLARDPTPGGEVTEVLVGTCEIEHMFGTVTGWSTTRSFIATPISRFSTARATRKSWRSKPPGSGSPPWPSPTTTASTARSASRSPPVSTACPRSSAPSLTLGIERPPNGIPDPEGEHLVVLAEGPAGYARLARAISEAQFAGEKGAPRTTIPGLATTVRAAVHLDPAPSAANNSWFVLTGCRKGTVPAALVRDGPAAARRARRAGCRVRS